MKHFLWVLLCCLSACTWWMILEVVIFYLHVKHNLYVCYLFVKVYKYVNANDKHQKDSSLKHWYHINAWPTVCRTARYGAFCTVLVGNQYETQLTWSWHKPRTGPYWSIPFHIVAYWPIPRCIDLCWSIPIYIEAYRETNWEKMVRELLQYRMSIKSFWSYHTISVSYLTDIVLDIEIVNLGYDSWYRGSIGVIWLDMLGYIQEVYQTVSLYVMQHEPSSLILTMASTICTC